MKQVFTILMFASSLTAQDFEFKKFALGEMLDFPSSTAFAEEGDSVLWLQYSTTDQGSTVDRLLKYTNDVWTQVEFTACTACIRDIKQGPDGSVYIAGTEAGIFKRENGEWNQFLDIEARGLSWKSTGDMVIINSTGMHTYDGSEITEANNENVPEILNLNDLATDRTDDVYMVLPSKLYMHTAEGWQLKTELSTPMSIDVDSENKLWVSDNFGDIAYYLEGDYAGGQYFNFGTNDLVVDKTDVLWYSDDFLTRNEGGVELEIPAADLIDEALLLQTIFVDHRNDVWVTSNFKSGVARVTYLGEPTSSKEEPNISAQLMGNPVATTALLNVISSHNEDAEVVIFNRSGTRTYSRTHNLTGGQQVIKIDTKDFPPGIYFLQLVLQDSTKTIKLIKQ